MNFEKQIEKLGIKNEVKSIIENCDCGVINYAYIDDLTKIRKWEIQETIGNYLDADLYGSEFCCENRRMKTFCKAFGIEESEIAQYYAEGICEGGYSIAYAITENLVLVLEEREEGNLPSYITPMHTAEEEPAERFVANYNYGDKYIYDIETHSELTMEDAMLLINDTIGEERFELKTLSTGNVYLKDNNVRRLLNVYDTADFLNTLNVEIYNEGAEESASSSNSIEENGDDDMGEKIVEFKLQSKNDNRIYIAGTFDINSYDEDFDDGDWEYEQNDGTMASHLPTYWKVNGESLSFEYGAFIDCIDWESLRQYLFEFQDSEKSIDCGVYLLHINGGAIFKVDIEKDDDFEENFNATLNFTYNEESIVFDEDILDEFVESLTYDEEAVEVNQSSFTKEIPKSFSDYIEEDYEGYNAEIISEWLQYCRKAYARQLVIYAGIRWNYSEVMEEQVEDGIASDREEMFAFECAIENDEWINRFLENYLYIEE